VSICDKRRLDAMRLPYDNQQDYSRHCGRSFLQKQTHQTLSKVDGRSKKTESAANLAQRFLLCDARWPFGLMQFNCSVC
jgi:hypothetical protein